MGISLCEWEQMFGWHRNWNGNWIETYGNGKELES